MSEHYGDKSLGALQNRWLDWVRRGSPKIAPPAAAETQLVAQAKPRARPRPNLIYRAQSADPPRRVSTGAMVPVPRGWTVAGESLAKPDKVRVASYDAGPATKLVRAPSAPEQHQAVRPQYPQRARQIIFEWSRTAGATSRQPAASPPASVYDASSARSTRLR